MGRENLLVAAIGICEAKLDGFGFDSPTQHEKKENFFSPFGSSRRCEKSKF
jgi:hypothetical protein